MDNHSLNEPLGSGDGRRWMATSVRGSIELGVLWVISSEFRTLVDALGGPAVVDVDRDLPALVEWSSRTLDTRMGAERQAAAPVTFPDSQVAALLSAAGPLGLLRTQAPILPHYDITVVLGGTITGNELRTKLAEDFASTGIGIGQVVGLAADRAIAPGERDTNGHRTEAEHLDSLLTVTFGRDHPDPWNEAHARQSVEPERSGRGGSGTRILTAPSSRPGRRADTEDAILFSFSWWLHSCLSVVLGMSSWSALPRPSTDRAKASPSASHRRSMRRS
jgi:hypothetical protein